MRREFADELYKKMADNPDIYLLTADLGYIMWDKIKEDFPDRFIQCGASEQAMLDIAVGLAYEGKIPFCYSITPFLLYRGFETLRTYINKEKLNVKLVGSGRDKDYEHDGFSHDATDVTDFLDKLKNVRQFWPATPKDIPMTLNMMLETNGPVFISLKR